jgi:hypothetical protein
LLTVAGDPAAEAELSEVLPQLRSVVDARVESPRPDYWDLATSLELAVLEQDWTHADRLIAPVRARAAAPWMFESTVNNLRVLAQGMSRADDRGRLERLLREMTPEVGSR